MAEAKPIDSGDDAPGGARSRTIDLTTIKDQGTVRAAIRRWPKRWRGLSDSFKDSLVDDLVIAKTKAIELIHSEDPVMVMKAIDAINSTARTAVAMEGQNQADEHREQEAEENAQRVAQGPMIINVVQVGNNADRVQLQSPAETNGLPHRDGAGEDVQRGGSSG